MTFDPKELRERFRQQSTDELLKLVNVDSAAYQAEAIDCAKDELRSRGLWYLDSDGGEKYGVAEESLEKRGRALLKDRECGNCGGEMRSGSLFVGSEVSLQFHDNYEQKVVEAQVCGRCGVVRLVVDLDSEIVR